jgi:hypothetical protein
MRWLVIGIFVGNSPSNTLGVRSIPKTCPRGRRSRLRLEDLPSSRLRFRLTMVRGSAPQRSFHTNPQTGVWALWLGTSHQHTARATNTLTARVPSVP